MTKRNYTKTIKARQRNHSFKYLTKYAGKGVREGIRLLHRKDSENRIVEIYSDQDQIEKAIMNHNIQHYQKVHHTKIYNDKIYSQLEDGAVRNKILTGQLRRSDCDSSNVYQFLSLLKQPEEIRGRDHFQPITSEEQTTAVLRAKKRSAS